MKKQKADRREMREEMTVTETEESGVAEKSDETGKETVSDLFHDNRGVGVVEIILILVVLIALVVIFKEQLTAMVTKALDALEKSMEEVMS